MDHPHVHCIVTGGGLSPDRSRWVSGRKGFFIPVKVMSRLFRGKFLDYLKRNYEDRKLTFPSLWHSLWCRVLTLDITCGNKK
jgi:hypothetical protein